MDASSKASVKAVVITAILSGYLGGIGQDFWGWSKSVIKNEFHKHASLISGESDNVAASGSTVLVAGSPGGTTSLNCGSVVNTFGGSDGVGGNTFGGSDGVGVITSGGSDGVGYTSFGAPNVPAEEL